MQKKLTKNDCNSNKMSTFAINFSDKKKNIPTMNKNYNYMMMRMSAFMDMMAGMMVIPLRMEKQ